MSLSMHSFCLVRGHETTSSFVSSDGEEDQEASLTPVQCRSSCQLRSTEARRRGFSSLNPQYGELDPSPIKPQDTYKLEYKMCFLEHLPSLRRSSQSSTRRTHRP